MGHAGIHAARKTERARLLFRCRSRAGRDHAGLRIYCCYRRSHHRDRCRNPPVLRLYKLKSWLGYDDALDTFGIHAVGGTLGAFLTGIFATASINPNLALSVAGSLNPATQNGLARIVGHTLWIEQLKAIVITILVAVVG